MENGRITWIFCLYVVMSLSAKVSAQASCADAPTPDFIQNLNCDDLTKNVSLIAHCGCTVYLDTIKALAGEIYCYIQQAGPMLKNISSEAAGAMPSSDSGPMGMMGMKIPPQLFEMVNTLITDLMDKVMGPICDNTKLDQFQQCVNAGFAQSTLMPDVYIRAFVDSTKLSDAFKTFCGARDEIKNNLQCFFQTAPSAVSCVQFSGTLSNLTMLNEQPSPGDLVNGICPIINEVSPCSLIALETCSSKLKTDMESMMNTLLSPQCKGAMYPADSLPLTASMFVYCATPMIPSIMATVGSINGDDMSKIISAVQTIANQLCRDGEVAKYATCVADNVPGSARPVDKYMSSLLSVPQFVARDGAFAATICSNNILNNIEKFGTCNQLQTTMQTCAKTSLGQFETLITQDGRLNIPDTQEQIRTTYCSSLTPLTECFLTGTQTCAPDLVNTARELQKWLFHPQCGGNPTQSTLNKYVGDNGGSVAISASYFFISLAALLVISF